MKPPLGLKNREEIGRQMTEKRTFWTENCVGKGTVVRENKSVSGVASGWVELGGRVSPEERLDIGWRE